MSYKILIERFISWAENYPEFRSAIIMGSQARQDHAADHCSDLDMIIYTINPQKYLAETDWLENIGKVWISLINTGGDSIPLLRVLFEEGYIVDFFIHSDNDLKKLVKDGVYPLSFHRGAKVILDKDGLAKEIIPPHFEPIPLRPPVREEFLHTAGSFWYGTIYIAKKLIRGELWLFQVWDAKIKELLLKMLQWHARVINGWDHDTWYFGHFLEEWADRQTVKELSNAFAHYNKEDSCRALLATMNIFRRVAKETAQRLNYPYPETLDDNISAWVKKRLPDNSCCV